jgi:hypothetical protein
MSGDMSLGQFPSVAILPAKEVREKRALIEHRRKLVGRRVRWLRPGSSRLVRGMQSSQGNLVLRRWCESWVGCPSRIQNTIGRFRTTRFDFLLLRGGFLAKAKYLWHMLKEVDS